MNYERTEHKPLGPRYAPDLEFLAKNFGSEWSVGSRTEDDKLWTVSVSSPTRPATSYLYNREAKTLTKLFDARPKLADAPLADMHPVIIKARDGLDLVSFLTVPKGSDAERAGRPDQPLPMVLFVHGGPWSRDHLGYNAMHQWLANRGYAVLSVNFRSSTGFGKAFVNAGDKEWGRKMDDDLLDAVAWAIREKIADPSRIGIMGGSYGGYATLAGADTQSRHLCLRRRSGRPFGARPPDKDDPALLGGGPGAPLQGHREPRYRGGPGALEGALAALSGR